MNGICRRRRALALLAVGLFPLSAPGQIRTFPFQESFDATVPPALPGGWESSRNRVAGADDFAVSVSVPLSPPCCLYAQNATVAQWVASPVCDLTGIAGGSIRWSVRTSASFGAALLLEASTDGGASYPYPAGDTVRVPSSGEYLPMVRPIPGECAGETRTRFRWRVIPGAAGSAGTLRIDDCAFVPETGETARQVRIDEIMYAPAAGEPEWVEIVNADSAAADLNGWSISDAAVASRHPLAAGEALMGPGERRVLTKDSAALSSFRFTPGWRVLSVAGFPSLNNGGDAVVICRRDGVTADSVLYRPAWGGAEGGMSLERWDALGESADSTNWGSCRDTAGGTPGKMNSIARRDRDVTLVAGEGHCIPGGGAALRAHAVNRGREAARNLRVSFYRRAAQTGVPAAWALIGETASAAPLAPLDSLRLAVEWIAPPDGDTEILAAADAEGEERRGNDTTAFVLRVPAVPGSVLVNEIMFAPLPGEPEYVELFNAGTRPAALGGWSLRDRTAGGEGSVLQETGVPLLPGSFAVIAGDSSLPRFFPRLRQEGQLIVPRGGLVGLNNDGDEVVLRDPAGITVDSVAYSPAWHSPAVADVTGRSLERRIAGGPSSAPWNWSTCTLSPGGSPGEENSIALRGGQREGTLSCSPNPFSPDGDGRDDATVIHFSLPPGRWSLGVEIYDARGRLIRRLASAMAGEGEGNVLWDGRDDLQRKARIGLYAAVLEAWDPAGGATVRWRAVVALAGEL